MSEELPSQALPLYQQDLHPGASEADGGAPGGALDASPMPGVTFDMTKNRWVAKHLGFKRLGVWL